MMESRKNPLSQQSAIVEITALMHRAQTGGNVDYEKNAFEKLIQKVAKQEITPEQGVEEARRVTNRREER